MKMIPVCLCLAWATIAAGARTQEPQTVAETSGYMQTGTHADVMAFLEALDAASEKAVLKTLGHSTEGKPIPALYVADSLPVTPADAREQEKLVAVLIGNIHAGEVCGKEALQMLAREIALAEDSPLLDDYILIFVPIYNADGNDRMNPDNRPGQVGPEKMGERVNGQGLDLNRDYVKMEAPETRALAKLMRDWDPDIIVDTHTTNGSRHRYVLTYAGPKHPAQDQPLLQYVRGEMFPAVSAQVEVEHGWKTYFYGNFNDDRTRWETYPTVPRYGTPYRGLRNRIAILTEAYSYAPFKDRVLATLDFVRGVLAYGAAHKEEIRELIAQADERVAALGEMSKPADQVAIRTRLAVTWEDVPIAGFVEDTDEPTDVIVDVCLSFEPELSVQRPWAYLVPARFGHVVENLLRHGIEVQELREDVELNVEAYRIDSLAKGEREWQGHHLVTIDATPTQGARRVEAGTFVVPTGQPLGTLAVLLLEPESEDGLATWELFEGALSEGGEFPIVRLTEEVPLLTLPARPLDEDRTFSQRVTFERLYESDDRPDFNGSPVRGVDWVDGEHYIQHIDDTRVRVHAPTGRRSPSEQPDLAGAFASLVWLDDDAARRIAWRVDMDDAGVGGIATYMDDLYWVSADGSEARRLTSTAQPEEMATLSPNGRFVAFVRDNNLWVVDVMTGTERALTTGGTDTLRYGKHDWVYYEELYGRSWKAFWWSPDSKSLLLFRTDSSMMDDFTIIDDVLDGQDIETVRYPNPGERNPQVAVGVVSIAGGDVQWVDLSGYDDGAYLVSGAGFTPDSKHVWLYVQDRAQTWLDVLTASASGGEPTRLFRDQTRAWISPSGPPRYLNDGSFLFFSERTGWQHIYHYSDAGSLLAPVTQGEYEVRSIERIDEEAGVIWVMATKDSHLAEHLYRVPIAGGPMQRLTTEPGDHRAAVSPSGDYFVDVWSSFDEPVQVALRDATGAFVRWIDTNPVRDLETYDLGRRELVKIPGEGDEPALDAIVTYPPDFHEGGLYPVWFMTYGGPHSPTVHDSWSWGFAYDQMLAAAGIIAFRADPYSASGKGAQSAWTAYRRMGVPELADVERAIGWLTAHPWADETRVGMSGHSYGGFLTAYVMTHSDVLSAGIAGAPVTDWRLYDTIYTERYMDTPQENPQGYEETSVIGAAKDLHGELLLLHGTMDDNVHFQNTIRLVDALQHAGKTNFEMFIYPGFRHGIWGEHYRRTMWAFIQEAMGIGQATQPEPIMTPEPQPANITGP